MVWFCRRKVAKADARFAGRAVVGEEVAKQEGGGGKRQGTREQEDEGTRKQGS